MTSGPAVSVDAAHAAAATAIQELYDEALRHLDAVARSLGEPTAAEQEADETQGADADAETATTELPRRIAAPVTAAA